MRVAHKKLCESGEHNTIKHHPAFQKMFTEKYEQLLQEQLKQAKDMIRNFKMFETSTYVEVDLPTKLISLLGVAPLREDLLKERPQVFEDEVAEQAEDEAVDEYEDKTYHVQDEDEEEDQIYEDESDEDESDEDESDEDKDEDNTYEDEDEDKTYKNEDEDKTYKNEDEDKTYKDEDEDKTYKDEDEDKTYKDEDEDKTYKDEDEDKTYKDEDEEDTFEEDAFEEGPLFEQASCLGGLTTFHFALVDEDTFHFHFLDSRLENIKVG